MNKTLFNYCQKHLRLVDSAQLKVNASLKQLVNDYNIGYIDNGFYYFNHQDKLHLVEVIAQELHGLRLSDSFPEKQKRTEIAHQQRNEKIGAINVTNGFVLLNSMQDLRINNQVLTQSTISSLGHFLCASDIMTIEHTNIVLVENLIIMANLSRLIIPDALKDAIWLYRGDTQAHQSTGTANQFFRRFKGTNELICFSDFDPAGLQIALSCGAERWLSLENSEGVEIELSGIEHEWFNQQNAITFVNNDKQVSKSVTSLLSTMNYHQKTLKQEHMVEHALPLTLYPLR